MMRRPTEKKCMLWHAGARKNHLSLNINKTKELVVDFRRQKREHTPIIINRTPVEQVSSFKFLGVHSTEDLTWSAHTDVVLKKAQQCLFFHRRLRKFRMSPHILHSFYTCTVESILTGSITAWYGKSTSSNRKALQRVVRTARHTVGGELPSLQDIYTRRCMRKAWRIISDSSHPSHRLFEHAQADWGTAFPLRLSGCWTLRTDTHTAPLSVHTIYHAFLTHHNFFFLPTGLQCSMHCTLIQ